VTGSSPEFCTLAIEGEIWIVTINRPHCMNAVHPPANFELAEIFRRFAVDDAARVAILTGAGDQAFCAGNDLRYVAEGRLREMPDTGFAGLTHNFSRTKPVIAAVNGLALGGGFEIALACDLIVAAETASFGLPEPRVGLAATMGGLHRLPRHIGIKQALGMILTGRQVTAAEGLRLGFVNEVVHAGEALAAARRWAAQICECAPLAIRTSLDVVKRGLEEASVEMAVTEDYTSVRQLLTSEDAREGPRAFVEKRKPLWRGC
jgi:crotonobetainyl-CoA hydratase